jgi:hypothetical protein
MGQAADGSRTDERGAPVHTVRLPKFLAKDTVGLGQVVKRVTKSVGVQPCAPCEQRAARLDQWLRFSPSEYGRKDHG